MGLIAGTSTTNVNITAPGNTASRPASPISGNIRFNTTLNELEGYSGSNWTNINPVIVRDSSLIFHVDFSNTNCYSGSGTAITNLISGGNTGTLMNGAVFNNSNGGCIQLDGSNDYINFGGAGLATAETTVEIWYSSSTNYTGMISGFIIAMDNFDQPENRIKIDSMRTRFSLYDNSAYLIDSVGTAATFSINTWVHAAFTLKNSSQAGYQNGLLTVSSTGSYDGSSNNNLGEFSIGTYNRPGAGYGGYFNGKVAQIRVYNRVLSSSEILQNYNSTKYRFT